MSDRNDFLVAATGCIPLLAYAGWHYSGRARWHVRMLAKAMVAASLLAFVMSHSRGAMIGLFALGLFYSALTGRFMSRFAIVLVVGIAVVVVMPASTWERLETIEVGTEQTEMSAANRIQHMTDAIHVTLENPVFGVGPGAFKFESAKFGEFTAEPHSVWLKCSSEYGLVGLVAFLSTLLVLTRKLLRIARRARLAGDKETEALATALCCAYVGYLMTGTFTSQFLGEYLWALIGLAGAFAASEESKFSRGSAPTRTIESAESTGVAGPTSRPVAS